VCFEREVSRRAQEPFERRRRVETLKRLRKSKILEEIALAETQTRPKQSGSQEEKRLKPLNTYKLFQVRRNRNLRRRSDSSRQISCGKKYGPLDQRLGRQRRALRRKQILVVGSECKGLTFVQSR
jgi:hypothetical protein